MDDTKDKIIKWLKEKDSYDSMKHSSSGSWCIVADKNGKEIKVIKPSSPDDLIVIRMDVGLKTDDGGHIFDDLGDPRNILLALKMEINRFDTVFTFPPNTSEAKPKGITVGHEIYEDGLTKDRFFRGFGEVFKTYRQIKWFIQTRTSYLEGLK